MVNEGNGVLNEKKTACHSTNNVINLSAIFLDAELSNGLDPLPHVTDFCEDSFVSPSLTVQTSPNRHHVYWLLDPLPPTKENVTKWKRIQAFLHSKLSSDRTMTDTPQILRIPGFNNVKKKFFVSHDHPHNTSSYDLNELYDLLLKHFPTIQDFKAHSPLPPLTEDLKIEEGDRHVDMVRRMRRLFSDPLFTLEDGECWINGYINRHIPDNRQFLNGNRVGEVKRIVQSCYTYAEEERQKIVTQTLTTHIEKRKKAPFELDPDFFYNAPGLVGELTRHIVNTSKYSIPSHAFAASVSLVGLCKARIVKGERSLPPLNYFLCIAPAGSGKTTIQTVFKEAITRLSLSRHVEDGIGSAPGLIQFLINSNGLGLTIYDEVKKLFQINLSKTASTWEKNISPIITELFSAYSSTYNPPTLKGDHGKKLTLSKPLYSILGFSQSVLLDRYFTAENVQEGLLPRFIILNADDRTPTNGTHRPIPTKIIEELESYIRKGGLQIEDTASDHNVPIDLTPKQTLVTLSKEALPIYQSFEASQDSHRSNAVSEKNGLEALFSRGAEQSYRLALAIASTPQIDAHTMEFCTTLMSNQTQWFYNRFNLSINQTDYSKETDRLYEKILSECSGAPTKTISFRDLKNRTRRWYKGKNHFENQLTELIDRGVVVEFIQDREKRLRLGDVTLD